MSWNSKQLELLVEVVPHAATIAFLVNPNSPTTPLKLRSVQAAAHDLNRQVFVLNASNDREFETIFGTLAEQRIEAMMIASDNIFANEGSKLGLVSATHNVPVISAYRAFVSAGGLMSYGTSEADAYHQVGAYTGSDLKGEKPADLPVQQPTKFEMVLNLKTAKALGLVIPPTVLALANEVIE